MTETARSVGYATTPKKGTTTRIRTHQQANRRRVWPAPGCYWRPEAPRCPQRTRDRRGPPTKNRNDRYGPRESPGLASLPGIKTRCWCATTPDGSGPPPAAAHVARGPRGVGRSDAALPPWQDYFDGTEGDSRYDAIERAQAIRDQAAADGNRKPGHRCWWSPAGDGNLADPRVAEAARDALHETYQRDADRRRDTYRQETARSPDQTWTNVAVTDWQHPAPGQPGGRSVLDELAAGKCCTTFCCVGRGQYRDAMRKLVDDQGHTGVADEVDWLHRMGAALTDWQWAATGFIFDDTTADR